MAISIRFEDQFNGSSNYNTQRERITLVLEENKIWEFLDKSLKIPTDVIALVTYQKKGVKARRIILVGVKGHVVSHMSRKKTTRQMWEDMTKIYQIDKLQQENGVKRETQEHHYVQD